MKLYIRLFIEFFKTGLFAVGGGLATIPFLNEMIDRYHWFTKEVLTNMIAISESTPGPMGVNMATYVGYQTTHSILGGIIATLGLILPSIIIICLVARFFNQFKENKIVHYAFYGLRPCVVALIISVSFSIYILTFFKEKNISYLNIFLFFIVFLYTKKFPKSHPILILLGCTLLGIVFQL